MLTMLGWLLLLTAFSIMAVHLFRRRQRRGNSSGDGWNVDGSSSDSSCDSSGGDGGCGGGD